MKRRINEHDIDRLIDKVLHNPTINESVTKISFDSLWNNFPKDSSAYDIFPGIMPRTYSAAPNEFGNACATRLSLAMNNVGVSPDSHFRTEKDWTYDGVLYPKNKPITASAARTPSYLRRSFGAPTYTFENTDQNVEKFLSGKDAFFVITNVPGWRASGHADIVRKERVGPLFKCGQACHFGEGGTIQAWVVSEKPIQTKEEALQYLVRTGKRRENIQGFGDQYLIAWAKGARSGSQYFIYQGKKFSTQTGKSLG